jgi:hypothetical protein
MHWEIAGQMYMLQETIDTSEEYGFLGCDSM